MSLAFRLFPSGSPPDDADKFLITRADVGSPTGFSNYLLTWAEIKAAVGASSGTPGRDGIALILEPEIEDTVPTPGLPGAAGTPGVIGRDGITMLLEADPPEDLMLVKGDKGDPGTAGAAGVQQTSILLIHDEIIEDQIPIQGIKGEPGTPGSGSGSDPFEGSYDPGSFTVVDGDYVVMGSELIVSGTNEIILEGNSTLVII